MANVVARHRRYPRSEGERFNGDADLVTVECPTCFVTYAIPESFDRAMHKFNSAAYPDNHWRCCCPFGHEWWWTGLNKEQQLRRRLKDERGRSGRLAAELDQTEASRRSQKAAQSARPAGRSREGRGVPVLQPDVQAACPPHEGPASRLRGGLMNEPRVEAGSILSERQTLRIVQVVDRARNTFPEDRRPEAVDFNYALAAHSPLEALVRVQVHDPDCELPLFTEILVHRSGQVAGEELLVRCEAAAARTAVAA